ncbi:hypothetical protein GCM10023188_25820 [Pontibacter saemangeumensis]|uniref:Uncharacterized protein n=1 Tax=Pontibacter saemangeumensis TaxID=1084525 RepID=A0ABP8LRW5_9BACT
MNLLPYYLFARKTAAGTDPGGGGTTPPPLGNTGTFTMHLRKGREVAFGPLVMDMVSTRSDMIMHREYPQDLFVTNDLPDYNKLDQRLAGIPEDDTGYLTFDYEGTTMTDLKFGNVGEPLFETALQRFIDIAQYTKARRTALRIGFYGLTIRAWHTADVARYNAEGKYDRLMPHVDFITPSVYLPYAQEEKGAARVKQYLEDNVKASLAYKDRFPHLEAVIYVDERIHVSNDNIDTVASEIAGRTLSYASLFHRAEVMAEHVAIIKNTVYNGVSPDGIMFYTRGTENGLRFKPYGVDFHWGSHIGIPTPITGTETQTVAQYNDFFHTMVTAIFSRIDPPAN